MHTKIGVKTTNDAVWIQTNGSTKVDLASTSYENLPKDWKYENEQSAIVVTTVIERMFDLVVLHLILSSSMLLLLLYMISGLIGTLNGQVKIRRVNLQNCLKLNKIRIEYLFKMP